MKCSQKVGRLVGRERGGRVPHSNIVNVKLVVGRKVRISHKPIRGWGGAPGNDDRSIVVKSRYHSQYSPGEFFLKMSDQSVLESVVVGLQK